MHEAGGQHCNSRVALCQCHVHAHRKMPSTLLWLTFLLLQWGPAFSPSGIHGGVELAGYDNAFIQGEALTVHSCTATEVQLRGEPAVA